MDLNQPEPEFHLCLVDTTFLLLVLQGITLSVEINPAAPHTFTDPKHRDSVPTLRDDSLWSAGDHCQPAVRTACFGTAFLELGKGRRGQGLAYELGDGGAVRGECGRGWE